MFLSSEHWGAREGLSERHEVSVESRYLCLLVRRGQWGRSHSRRLGGGCGKVQMGGDGVRTGCGVGEREQTAKALGDGTGGRFNVGYREEAGEVKDEPPPEFLVEDEVSSAVRTGEPGLGEGHGHCGRDSLVFSFHTF